MFISRGRQSRKSCEESVVCNPIPTRLAKRSVILQKIPSTHLSLPLYSSWPFRMFAWVWLSVASKNHPRDVLSRSYSFNHVGPGSSVSGPNLGCLAGFSFSSSSPLNCLRPHALITIPMASLPTFNQSALGESANGYRCPVQMVIPKMWPVLFYGAFASPRTRLFEPIYVRPSHQILDLRPLM